MKVAGADLGQLFARTAEKRVMWPGHAHSVECVTTVGVKATLPVDAQSQGFALSSEKEITSPEDVHGRDHLEGVGGRVELEPNSCSTPTNLENR